MKKNTEIIICGDLCPTTDTLPAFEDKNERFLFNDLLNVFSKSDFLMGNLEFVLTDNPKPIKKSGPVLHGKTNYIDVFKKSGFDLLCLANNHIKDCGEEGIESSIKTCHTANIDTVGAGLNLSQAKKAYIKEINGWKIGVIAIAEQEFNIASNDSYGANFLDVYYDFEKISKVKEEVDYLIILYHGGIEYYEYPSPILQKKCRKFIESGADFVVCQHSHCVGTEERYKGKKIIYGQGNTLFGFRENNKNWNEGLVIKIILADKDKEPEIILTPIEATTTGIKIMNPQKAKLFLEHYTEKSLKITDPVFIKNAWINFCKKKESDYLSYLLGFNRILIHINRILKNRLVKTLYSNNRMRTTFNITRCESHSEVIQTIFAECDLIKDE